MAALLKLPRSLAVPDFLRNPFRPTYLMVAAVIVIAVFLGLFTPLFVALTDGKISKLVALPAVMLFGLMLLYDRKLSLLVIMLFRSSADNVLELTRFAIGSYPLGIGALINGCIIMIAALLVFERPKETPSSAYAAWTPFLIVLAVGVAISPVKGDAVRMYLVMFSCFAVFVAGFHCVENKADFRRCVKLIVWSSVIPVLYSAVDIALNHSSAEFRLRSTFGHPNVLAFYTTVVIALTFYLLKTPPVTGRARAGDKLILSFYLVLLLAVLALTKTRSAWAATALTFGLYALIYERRYLVYMFLLGLCALMIPGVLDRFTDLEQGNTVGTYANLNSFAWRVYLWQTGINWMSHSSYLLGNGFQSFKEYSVIFFPFAGKTNWGAHSVYVQLFFELGAVGILAFGWLYFRVLKELVKLVKIDSLAAFSLIMVVVNFLICCYSDNMLDYLVYAWYLWFAVGAGCALLRKPQAAR